MYFQIEFEWQRRAVLNDLICNLANDIGVFWFCHKRKGNLIPGPEKKQNLDKNRSKPNPILRTFSFISRGEKHAWMLNGVTTKQLRNILTKRHIMTTSQLMIQFS